MKNIIYLFGAFLILMSCAEHATNNVQTVDGDYFPLNQGNYWVFDTWETDANNQEIVGTRAIDSLYVLYYGQSLFDNDNTYQAIVLRYRDKILIDTVQFKLKDEFIQTQGFYLDSTVRDDNQVYKYIDKKMSDFWNICTYHFDFTMSFSGFAMPCVLTSVYNSYSENNEFITVEGIEQELKMFKMRKDNVYTLLHKFDTSKIVTIVKWDTINGVPIESRRDTIKKYSDTCTIKLFKPKVTYLGLIKDIGYGKIIEKPYTVSSTKDRERSEIKEVKYNVNGRVSLLKRYRINKK